MIELFKDVFKAVIVPMFKIMVVSVIIVFLLPWVAIIDPGRARRGFEAFKLMWIMVGKVFADQDISEDLKNGLDLLH